MIHPLVLCLALTSPLYAQQASTGEQAKPAALQQASTGESIELKLVRPQEEPAVEASEIDQTLQDSTAGIADLQQARALLVTARGTDKGKGFEYQATYMRYYEVGDSILLQGQAVVLHKGAKLEAAEMVFRRKLDQVEARASLDSSGRIVGHPVLRKGDETLRGERILYNLESEQGTILSGRIHRDKGFFAGNIIQTRSAEEFHVHRGTYTTCDKDHPHFDFYSPRIKVLTGDLAVARPVYFRIARRRLFWIPFYVFSLREDRQSGILTPSFGNRPLNFGASQSEWELRNLGYYLAPNDYWDLSLATDLRQRSGWLGRARFNYALRYRFKGRINAQLENRQQGRSASRNWRVEFNHSQELGRDASLRAAGTFQSNKSFSQDNSSSLQDRLNRTLRSNLSYSKRWHGSGNSLSLKASQTKNLDTETFGTVLPEISLRKSRKPLWGGEQKKGQLKQQPWYSRIFYDGNARLRNSTRDTSTDTTERTNVDIGLRLSAQYRPFTWFNINPSLSEDWRDQDLRDGDTRSLHSDRFATRLALTQTAFGLFNPQIGPLQAVRHVFKPNLSLNYQATRADTGGVLGFGGDASPLKQQRKLDIRLDNSFWAKIQRGEDELKVRLAQLNFSTSYEFEKKERRLADLRSSMSIAAGRYLDSRLTLQNEFYNAQDQLQLFSPRLRQFEIRTSANWSRRATARQNDAAPSNQQDRSSYEVGSGQQRQPSNYGQQQFGFESGLLNDIDNRRRGSRFQFSHYYSQTRTTSSKTVRSWFRASAGFSLTPSWHCNYSINYNLRAPGTSLFATDRITSELLSLQKEFHDWTATLNVEPSTFHKNRAFFFKAQFKDIPQIKFERGERRF